MATASVQPRLTAEDILTALEQLAPEEMAKVSWQLLQMQAHRKAPHLSAREEELLTEIYRGKRSGFQVRFDELNIKRCAFTLTPEEHEELLQLVDESEAFTLRRLEALAELAQLWRLTLPALMKRLGLKAPPVG